MTDEQGNTPQDRRAVALSEDYERRHFVEQFVRKHAGAGFGAVIDVLDRAAASIAPSEDRDKLTAAVERMLNLDPSEQ